MTALPVNVRFVFVINCAVCGRIVWAFVTCGNGYAGRCVLVGWAWKMLCKLRVVQARVTVLRSLIGWYMSYLENFDWSVGRA